MQLELGLKNRLRLISLLPILILLSLASYYVYSSFVSYQGAQKLQELLQENKNLNTLIGNLSRERGMTVMYLGNKSEATLKSLTTQRTMVDKDLTQYSRYLDAQQKSYKPSELQRIKTLIAETKKQIDLSREIVTTDQADFNEIYADMYGAVLSKLFSRLEAVSSSQVDQQITSLAATYLSLAKAKLNTASERDYISYPLARSTPIDAEGLSNWLALIGQADAYSYDTLIDVDVKAQVHALFSNEDNIELFEDITVERSEIIRAVHDGLYPTEAGIWFTMLSEKFNLLDDAEKIILKAMDEHAATIRSESIQLLSVSLTVWALNIAIAIFGMFLANDIARNIKGLEAVLVRAAEDTRDVHGSADTYINLDTSSGTQKAYEMLDSIIEQTRQDKQYAVEASEAKSMFLANMSHEIRTPLNGIVGFTELLKDTDLHDEQREFIDIIEKSSENLLEIINNILDLSKIESNKLEIEEIAFNAVDEFESAVEVYAVRASEKHIDLGCFVDPTLERPIKGDPTKIKEVIINLLSNAIKFTNNGGAINVDIRRVESGTPNRTRIHFQVKDSGIGVTNEQKSKIFESFSQADTSITRKYGGTGLGLTISSRFVELMGGKLDLESEPGSGTTFFFTLEFEEIETLDESERGTFSNLNAVILESAAKSKSQTTYLKEYLDFFGVSYATFKTLDELRVLEHQVNYDLLLVDYEYCREEMLKEYEASPEAFILITKAFYMKKIDSMGLNIFKVMYEPLNKSKIQSILLSYDANDFAKTKKESKRRKNILPKATKFAAKALVAEDNVINQKLIKRTLEDLGLEITLASNGLEAFEKRKNGEYDIIFMDIQMPVLDGVEATMEILEFEEDFHIPHIPIIALTANALKGDRERFMEAGMDEYTTKPLVRSEILTLLNQFVGDKAIADEDDAAPITPKTVEAVIASEPEIETPQLAEAPHEAQLEPEAATQTDAAPLIENELPELEPQPFDLPIAAPEKTRENEPQQAIPSRYDADILIAKKSNIESRLFAHILDDMGYTYEVVNGIDALKESLNTKTYKLLLFDKELSGLDLKQISDNIKRAQSDVSLVMMIDPSKEKEESDALYVHEIIKNIVNKDLLRLVLEKFI